MFKYGRKSNSPTTRLNMKKIVHGDGKIAITINATAMTTEKVSPTDFQENCLQIGAVNIEEKYQRNTWIFKIQALLVEDTFWVDR